MTSTPSSLNALQIISAPMIGVLSGISSAFEAAALDSCVGVVAFASKALAAGFAAICVALESGRVNPNRAYMEASSQNYKITNKKYNRIFNLNIVSLVP